MKGDVGGKGVEKIGEGDETVDCGNVGCALEGPATCAAAGGDLGGVADSQISELVFYTNDRLRRKRSACDGGAGRLSLNG